jgi:hypothetical protein
MIDHWKYPGTTKLQLEKKTTDYTDDTDRKLKILIRVIRAIRGKVFSEKQCSDEYPLRADRARKKD